MENTSGQGAGAVVPAELRGWNWGAFLLNWIWGIGNNTYIAFLMFVPLVNVAMPFVLGAKGNTWAWRNKRWDGVPQFKAVQRQWAKWGAIVSIAAVVFSIAFAVALFFGISALFKNSGAFKLAIATLEANEDVSRVIGKPIATGFPMGNISTSGSGGDASLQFSISGPAGSGTVFVEETESLGQWHIDRMVLEQDKTGARLDLVH